MFKDMKAYAHLKPRQKGTLRLVEKYGDSLLCVRYRYDARRRMRLKTVEIIVEEKAGSHRFPFRNDDIVSEMVPYAEKNLRDQLKAAGGRWDPGAKIWRVRYGSIRTMAEVVERIVRE